MVRKGDGDQRAIFAAEIPRSGPWELEYHLPERLSGVSGASTRRMKTLNMKLIDETQFVEAEDRMHEGIPKLYYVRLSDADGNTMMRFYFPNPWLDEAENVTEFQPERLEMFEEFRDRYIGESGIVFAQV